MVWRFDMSIYKDCDLRGVYGSELTAAEVYRIGRALATLCPGRILVGGDVRLSTPELKKALMDGLRARPLTALAGDPVVTRRDYLPGVETDVRTGRETAMELRDSNVLAYILADGTKVLVRPSGTEPKIKVYILAQGESRAACDEKIARYMAWGKALAE